MNNLRNVGRRALSMLLALVMCFGLLDVTAFAVEEPIEVPIADGYNVEQALDEKFGSNDSWYYEAIISETSSGKAAQGLAEHPTVAETLTGTKQWMTISSAEKDCYWKIETKKVLGLPVYEYYKGFYSSITTHDNSTYTVSNSPDGSDAKIVTFVDAYETTITTNPGPFSFPVGTTKDEVIGAIDAKAGCGKKDPNWNPPVMVKGTVDGTGNREFELFCEGDVAHKPAEATVTVTFTNNKANADDKITLNDGAEVELVWSDATTIDQEASLAAAEKEAFTTELTGVTIGGTVKEGNCEFTVSRPEDNIYNPYTGTVTVNFVDARQELSLKEGQTVQLSEQGTRNYDKAREEILGKVVDNKPEGLTVNDVDILYYGIHKTIVGTTHNAYVPLEGGRDGIYQFDSISIGDQTIQVTYAGSTGWKPFEGTVSVTFTDVDNRGDAATLKPLAEGESYTAKIVYNDDGSVDADATVTNILNAVATVAEDVTPEITYYATAESGSLGDLGKTWIELGEGKTPV